MGIPAIIGLSFLGLWLTTGIASIVLTWGERSSGALGAVMLGWGWPFFVFGLWPYMWLKEKIDGRRSS